MHQEQVGQAIMDDSLINDQQKSQVLIYCLGFKLSFDYSGFQESSILTDYITSAQNIKVIDLKCSQLASYHLNIFI